MASSWFSFAGVSRRLGQRRANGACVHLGEWGCTVYEQRPAVCRSFDCRAFAAMGIVEHCAPGHETPDWKFAGR